MTSSPDADALADAGTLAGAQEAAKRNLWLHFTRMSSFADSDVPVIVRGSGAYVFDQRGRRYLDGLAGLFTVQVGHGRQEIAEAGARQAGELAYFPLWSYAHPTAIELAQRLAGLAPGDLNRVFFTTSGSEAVESAWKLAKQYFKLTGQPERYKVISRQLAYHGTSRARSRITGMADMQAPFEPMTPGGVRAPNTNFYRAPEFTATTSRPSAAGPPTRSSRPSCARAPESVAAVFLEPVQNSGGCFAAASRLLPAGREICDRYGVLLVSDEVICAFGRLGYYFGAQRYAYQPDIITFAKGVTSGYSPLGGDARQRRAVEPFSSGTATFLHGITFAGHPVSHRGGAGQPRHLRARGPARRTCAQRGRVPRHPGQAQRPADRRATSGAPATSTASSWSRTRPPRRRSTTTSPSGCCAASCRTRCSTPGWSAAPTTAATRWSSWPRR